jgi:hypothetical protein
MRVHPTFSPPRPTRLLPSHSDKPRIGDRRVMRVAGEIGEHARGSAERRLGVDNEWALPQRAHAVIEGLRLGERSQFAEEVQLSFLGLGFEAVEEQAAERLRQRMDGEQEVRFGFDPALRGRRRRRALGNGRGDDGPASVPRYAKPRSGRSWRRGVWQGRSARAPQRGDPVK